MRALVPRVVDAAVHLRRVCYWLISDRFVGCLQRVFYVRFEVFTAGMMKNAVFWDIKPSSYLTGDTLRLRYRDQPVNAT
jgi:hypothetical protein